MRSKLIALSVLILLATSLRAHAQTLEGTWVAVLDVKGLVYPHVEELRIARDGSVATMIYGIRDIPECDGKPPAPTGPCAPGQANVTGKLAVNVAKATIAVRTPRLSAAAMSGIGKAEHDERLARELFWFGPGEPWTFRREANVLAMSRRSQPIIPNTELDGSKAIVIEKRFHSVDAAFAADLIALAIGGDYPLVKMACLMPLVSGKAASAREFRALMRDVAAVTRKRENLLASVLAEPGAAVAATLGQVLATLSAKNGAPSAQDIAATAAALGVRPGQVERFVREIAMRPRERPADALVFSMFKSQTAEIRACHARYFE